MSKESTLPCPFCGGKAEIIRELNCDTLSVSHAPRCFLFAARTSRFHWNDPLHKPNIPFADWNVRHKEANQ